MRTRLILTVFLAAAACARPGAGWETISDVRKSASSPAIICDRDGRVWVAWISYDPEDGKDHILLRKKKSTGWSNTVEVSRTPGDFQGLAMAQDWKGRVWLVWSANVNGNWDLYALRIKKTKLSSVFRLTKDPAPDVFPVMSADKEGTLWLCYQSFSEDNWDIFLKCLVDQPRGLFGFLEGDKWSGAIRVTASPANDYLPAIAVDSETRVHVVWDSYDCGDYDVFTRSYMDGELTPVVQVTGSKDFEARADAACDAGDRLWIAWENGGPGWGMSNAAGGLHSRRTVGLKCVAKGRLMSPRASMDQILGARGRFREAAHLAAGPDGRLHLFYTEFITDPAGTVVKTYFVSFDGKNWSKPREVISEYGRCSRRPVTCFDADGRLWVVLAMNARRGGEVAGEIKVKSFDLPPAKTTGPELKLERTIQREPAHFERTTFKVVSGETEYTVYFGDLHRRTCISRDGAAEGSLLELYRYALDCARLDFVASCDELAGGSDWWRTQKAADIFNLGGRLVTLFGYERAIIWPWGHRGVFWPERGRALVSPFIDESRGCIASDDEVKLWEALRKTGGISVPHGTAGPGGTDWDYGDPAAEPLAEIFEGARGSYEADGAPKAVKAGKQYLMGYIWNALEKGYRLGFTAGSGFGSNNAAFTGVLAKDLSREALFEALRARRTYACTEKIGLEFRIADHFMGSEITASRALPIYTSVVCTADIVRIELIKDNKVIFTYTPDQPETAAEFTYIDSDIWPGLSYYYIRVTQKDRSDPADTDMAWSSPIWVNYEEVE